MSMIINLVVGNLFRVLVFRLISKSGGLAKPVNLITAFDEAIKMVTYTWNILVIIAALELNQKPLASYTGPTFCHISNYVGTFSIVSNLAVGLGIALLRLAYILTSEA